MKSGWLILWNAVAICEMFKTSWQTGKHLMNGYSENYFKVRSFRLVRWSDIIRFLLKTSRGSTNLVRKFWQEYSSDIHLSREEFGKEIFWSQTLRSWKIWTRLKFMHKAEEVLTSKKGETFMFPIADETAKLFGRDHGVRESTLKRDQPVMSDDLREELHGNSERSQPTETKDDAEARNDFWSMEGDFIYRHHVEPH